MADWLLLPKEICICKCSALQPLPELNSERYQHMHSFHSRYHCREACPNSPAGSFPPAALTCVSPVQKRLNTSRMFPPFCMEITLRWSSSLIQTRKVLLSLCLKRHKPGKLQRVPGAFTPNQIQCVEATFMHHQTITF